MKGEEGRGPWLELASGKCWYLEHPRAQDVDITDIASALSKLARFGGHTKHFYSVAQHCVLAADCAGYDGLSIDQILHVLRSILLNTL